MAKQKGSKVVLAMITVFLTIALFLPLRGVRGSWCMAAEPCECDLNEDGICDMQDWLLFGQDWGRTDCPTVYPATVALDGTVVPYHAFTNVLINGSQFSGPVAPGASVQVSFDWSREQIPTCPYCIHQHYVGFAGEPATCVQSGQAPASGSANVVLTAPTTPGRHVIAGVMTLEMGCQSINIPADPDFDSYLAIVRVEEP
jgi:hypothetical protein